MRILFFFTDGLKHSGNTQESNGTKSFVKVPTVLTLKGKQVVTTIGTLGVSANIRLSYFDILPSVNEGDSIGFYEATGSTPSRFPTGSCFRPPLRFDSQAIPVCPTVDFTEIVIS